MIRKYGLFAVWVIATGASFCSLYLTEIAHYPRTNLTWAQWICLFPLVIMAGKAAWHGFYQITSYLFPLTAVGLGLSAYQLIFQKTSPTAWLSLVAFTLINVILGLIAFSSRKRHYENK